MSEEQVIFTGSPSIITRFGTLSLAFLIMAASITGVFMLTQPWLWILAGLAFIYILGVLLVVKSERYEVTTERIRHRRGILTKRTEEVELYRANDTSLIEPLSHRVFGLGTIEVRTADATAPLIRLEAIHGARDLREQLRKYIEECRERKRVRLTEFE